MELLQPLHCVGLPTKERNMKPGSKLCHKTPLSQPQPQPQPQDESPIRAIACLKKIDDMKRFEDTEDCFILGFDPSDPLLRLFDASASAHHHDNDDLSFLAEKGQIALRDYPHSRHLCLKFPFKTTPHESYCEMCYCYVCDSAAPCEYWTLSRHCNAENVGYWKDQRKKKKQVH